MRRRALLTTALAAGLAAHAAAPAAAQGLLERLAGTGVGASAFVQAAAIINNFEIDSSRIVLARSAHPQIRDFAQRMIDQHTAMSAELRANPEATTRLPTALDERHTNMLLVLHQQPDVDLLHRYFVQQQIEAHEEAITAFEAYANGGDVPSLRSFAQRHLPTLREHLQLARALQVRPAE